MFYTALNRDQFVFSDASLDAVLAFVLACIDPTVREDCVVWGGGLVAAVVLASGRVLRLDAQPVPAAA